MGSALNLIQTIKLSSGTGSSITFKNIPQSFTDLKIIGNARVTTSPNSFSAKASIFMDCGKNKKIAGFAQDTTYGEQNQNFTSFGAYGYTHSGMIGIAATNFARANTFSSVHTTIMDYTNPVKCAYLFRSVNHHSMTTQYQYLDNDSFGGGTIAGEGIIDSITITPMSGLTFSQHTEFSLYGVA
jgi:hypothetical protein